MRIKLRIVALLLALISLGIWFFGGQNLGWTKTSVTHQQIDPVTEIEVNVYDKGFAPGIDFLGAGLALAACVGAASCFVRTKSRPPN